MVLNKGDRLHQAIDIPLSITIMTINAKFPPKNKKKQNKNKTLTLRFVLRFVTFTNFLKEKRIGFRRKKVGTRKLLDGQ